MNLPRGDAGSPRSNSPSPTSRSACRATWLPARSGRRWRPAPSRQPSRATRPTTHRAPDPEFRRLFLTDWYAPKMPACADSGTRWPQPGKCRAEAAHARAGGHSSPNKQRPNPRSEGWGASCCHFREHPRPRTVNTPRWRWRESNPRPSVRNQGFSGRILSSLFSAPAVSQARCRQAQSL